MMIVVTIGAVLSVVAVHGFSTLRQSSSIAGEISDFMGQMEFARAEALRQGSAVVVCVSTSGTGCTSGTAWDAGYIVFSDANSNGSYDTGDTILRRQKAFSGGDTMTPDTTSAASIFKFNRLGYISNIAANTTVLMTVHARVSDTSSTQCVSVTLIGKLTQMAAGGSCT
jgi:type IV fimbrial biogenesis protein FimT